MSVTLTVRDVPEAVRDALADVARARGQSLQAFLIGVLNQQAAFARNARVLNEIERDLAEGGGAGVDAPDSADLLDQARPTEAGHPRRGPGSAA
jgi:antitoxin FitA